MSLVQFQQPVDHYATGDVVNLSAKEKERVDQYIEVNGIKGDAYKTVTKAQAEKLGGSGSIETENNRTVVDQNDETVKNDPAPQTPVAGDGTVKVQDPKVATGQVAPSEGDGADGKVTAADRKAAKEAAKKAQAPAQQ